MLKVLLKKQLMEVFRMYFYDAKKNQKRSTGGVIAYFALFFGIMIGFLGGLFTTLSSKLCGGLVSVGLNWLYFVIMAGISIVLGAFGSVFNTFSSLYLSKDNDLLFSMPIPPKYIIASRLLNVYLLGTMYSAMAFVPSLIVYWIKADTGFMNGLDIGFPEIICGIAMMFVISLIVLILSCILGFGVARISLKLKKKSFATVAASLLFMGAYYFFYFKAQSLITKLLENATVYGEKIQGSAYVIYLFGKAACGDFKALLIFLAAIAILTMLTWLLLKKTFLSTATATGKVDKKVYKEKTVKEKSLFSALLSKELSKFISSPNYMLNCGLGILFIPVCGIIILVKGNSVIEILQKAFQDYPGCIYIIFATLIIGLVSMNDLAAPSYSLEGKNIWILQSMPIPAKMVIRAKTAMHLILVGVPVIFTLVCGLIVIKAGVLLSLIIIALVLSYVAFSALLASYFGVRMANLSWTNEIIPVKQSTPVFISMFGGWGLTVAFAGIYMAVGYHLPATFYTGIWTVIFMASAIILGSKLSKKGAALFEELQ